jgi:hypothetical protein
MKTLVWIFLLVVLTAVGVAYLAARMRRIATAAAEPPAPPPDDASADAGADELRHELMTTSEGTRLLLRQGHLIAPVDSTHKESSG